jgi:hypothetical protein
MKPHPRIRKTVKWGGAACVVGLCVIVFVSRWWCIVWPRADGLWWDVGCGCTTIGYDKYGLNEPGLRLARVARPGWDWWFDWGPASNGWQYDLPLWIPAALLLVLVAIAWRLDAIAFLREHPHLCRKCRYDRTGLQPGTPCPECGGA